MTRNKKNCFEDDLITLRGCGIQTMWRFPEHLTSCPVLRCNFTTDSHSKLINHYKAKHAKHSILCDVCNKPIMAKQKHHFKRHFWRIHPNIKVSYGLGNEMATKIKTQPVMQLPENKKVRCKYCCKMFSSGNLNRHISEVHSLKRINCPWKNCTFSAKRVTGLREHWKKKHSNLRFPEIRKRSIFIYQTTLTSNNNNQEDVSANFKASCTCPIIKQRI